MTTPNDERRRWPTSVEEFERQFCEPGEMSPRFRENWERVKAMYRDGDEWWGFTSPAYAWQHLAGCQGIELIRDGQVVEQLVTCRS